MKLCRLWARSPENTQTSSFCSLTRCSTCRQKSWGEPGTIGRESKMAGPCFWWFNFLGLWWPPLSLRLLVSAQAEICVCQSQQTASSVNTEDFRENAWLEGQQLYRVNSGVGTENLPGLECNQETWSLLKLFLGWTTDKYWTKLWPWFHVCAWGDKDAFPKDPNT